MPWLVSLLPSSDSSANRPRHLPLFHIFLALSYLMTPADVLPRRLEAEITALRSRVRELESALASSGHPIPPAMPSNLPPLPPLGIANGSSGSSSPRTNGAPYENGHAHHAPPMPPFQFARPDHAHAHGHPVQQDPRFMHGPPSHPFDIHPHMPSANGFGTPHPHAHQNAYFPPAPGLGTAAPVSSARKESPNGVRPGSAASRGSRASARNGGRAVKREHGSDADGDGEEDGVGSE